MKPAYKIAVSGASGLVGSALVPSLTADGHAVGRLVRAWPASGEHDVFWDPAHGKVDRERLEGLDAIVHLAGENIAAGRWTDARKELIRQSRVTGTRLLSESLARLQSRPKVLIAASAIGYYGNRGDDPVDESAPAGDDFLATVCKEWEAATEPAARAGIRVVNARLGIVLSPKGGALGKMLGPFRLGAGGRIGSGAQPMSWVALDDVIAAIHYALFNDSLSGPINVVAPNPVTNAEFTTILAKALKRPAFMTVPAFAIKAVFGEMGRALLLEGARVIPRKLLDAGFHFQYPTLDGALGPLLETSRSS
ncbi:MAG TPA: TIGR01777 family oxidoreductase [Polyangia bacterium]|nr:TIGR01777 family oxidoreductase [Polyangia bacterium]